MAYEHKAMISNSISKNKDYFFTTTAKGMKDELQEVYRKAKAFDEVIELTKTEFVSEDLADNIRILVNDYEFDLERADDER